MAVVNRERWLRWLQTTVMVVLGGIGGAAGFTHTHDWAQAHGQTGWLAWADAVVIEGMAVVAGLRLHHDRTVGNPIRFPAAVLAVAFIVQMISQVALAEPSAAGWLVAAMPALGFLIVVKLALRPSRGNAVETPVPQPETVQPATPPELVTNSSPREKTGGAVDKLPSTMRKTVLDLADKAHREQRGLTPADIQQHIGIPDRLATELVTELSRAA
ncbi:DUF2637 domain-containing protein [Sciscionella marina]|uniref:DUF2637 domain-containing protein n=1 Tax=Sciscionella marina TaxID=508770 RepID=UPI000684D637|nr:DUF2637 domain-containing protein [Sciscionella marina]